MTRKPTSSQQSPHRARRGAAAAALALAGMLTAGGVQAAPFGTFDARSAGMGDVGVATSNLDNAAFFNPAMLANHDDDTNFALLLPVVGLRAGDPDGLVNDIKDFQDAYNAGNVAQAQSILDGALGKGMSADGNAAGSLAFGTEHWAGALTYNRYARYGLAPTGTTPNNAELHVRGYQATEIGVSLAHKFGSLSVGITPKTVAIKTYDYAKPLSQVDTSLSGIADKLDEKDEGSNVNLDAGLAYDIGANFKLGLVGRNLSSKTYKTALGNTIKVDPQYRAGFAYDGSLVTVGVDYDLSENDPVSYDQKTRMLAVGAEFDALGWAQLRVGYAKNLANTGTTSKQEYYSAGIGLSPFGAHLDLAVSGNSHSLGGFAQLGFRF